MNKLSHVVLPGSAREVRPGARVLGSAGPEEWIEITLKLRRKQALPEPLGGTARVLSRAELEANYGASADDVEKVRAVLTEQGLTILSEDLSSSSVKAGGPADVVEEVFGLKLLHYMQDGERYRGRRGNLHIPEKLEGIVVGVFGLDTRRMVKKRPRRKRPRSLELAGRRAAARSWFFPAELATIYNFPAGDGKGQTVGLLEFGGGYFEEDLVTFCKNANISTVPVVKTVSVNGTPVDQRDGAEGEVMLDVEVVGGVCPAATIVVYFSTFDENGWISALDKAVHDDDPVSVISISWGYAEDAQGAWSEGAIDAINDTLKAAALLGVTVCVASGDDGSDDQVGDGHAHVDFPSSSPYVLAVGGTTLRKGASGQVNEVAWKDGDGLRQDNGGSTGGGVSVHFPRPDWQNVKVKSVNPGSIEGRVIPDVAANASANTGYWTVVDGQGGASGGTSASAPLWAALVARINENLAGSRQVGYLTPLLYQQGGLGKSGCRDITSGNNITASIGGYTAGTGYDAVTGWGVPDGGKLLEGLKGLE